MVTTFTYKPNLAIWRGSMHAIWSYRGNRPTNKLTHPQTKTHTHTHRHDQLQYTAPQLASVQCKNTVVTDTIQ